ncbi:MAG TPA: hypothetical protein PKM78_13975 [Anaerolineae bacterium]|nr:hypothetical protein [Anaerolineae bacterium]HNU05530.1 hypothetical protein [Anaerolineae bacterium]
MRDIIRAAALLFGLLAAAFSLLAALLLALAAALSGDALRLMNLTLLVSMLTLGVGLGLPLAAAARRSMQQRASPALRLPPAWWLGLIFLGLLLLGQLILTTPLASAGIPALHVAASLMPPLLVVAAIAPPLQRAGAGLTRRSLATQFSYGGLVSISLALFLELALITIVFILAGAGVALLPGGAESVERLAAELQARMATGDLMGLASALLSPGLVLGLGLLVAAAVPLIEELIKSLGVPFDAVVQGRLTRAQAFAFGVMAGVGFSFAEALVYGAQQLPHNWVQGVALRALTAVIHAAATGLFALGWYEVAAGRALRFFPYAAGGVAIHALWNGLSGLLLVTGLATLNSRPGMMIAGDAGMPLAVALLASTWLAALAVLIVATRRLSASREASHAG